MLRSKSKKNMRVCMLLIVMLYLLTGAVFAQQSPEEIFQDACIPLAIEFLKLGAQLGQENYYIAQDPRIKINPNHAGTVYDEVLSETIKKLRDFIKMYPDSAYADDAQIIIANLMNLKPQESITEWEIVAAKYPDGQIEQWSIENLMFIPLISKNNLLIDVALLKIGEMFFLESSWDSAEQAFRRLTKRYEASPLRELPDVVRRAHFGIVRTYEKRGDVDGTLGYLQEMITKYPDSIMGPQAQKLIDKVHDQINKAKQNAEEKNSSTEESK